MNPVIRRRIEHGVELLDQKVPGWWERIDLDTLNVGDAERCIIGQLFPDSYGRGLEVLGDPIERLYGFDADSLLGYDLSLWQRYRMLTDGWREIITQIREVASWDGA